MTLIIKTFPNPHNEVGALLEAARWETDDYPNVVLIESDLTGGELKALMAASDALVAPSRGEGFGLPIAEAMLSGLAVIATAHGGHMDFCTDENSWLVDYDSLAHAHTLVYLIPFGRSPVCKIWLASCVRCGRRPRKSGTGEQA